MSYPLLEGHFYVLLFCIVAYFVGSIPCGVVLSKILQERDPRTHGSGNIGTTNVWRVMGKKRGMIVLIGDVGKAFLCLQLSHYCLGETWQALVGLSVVLGHMFSVFLNFRGGKGIACVLGFSLGCSGSLGMLLIGIWTSFFQRFKMSSLAGLGSTLFLPLLAPVFIKAYGIFTVSYLMVLLIFFAHRGNFKEIFQKLSFEF